MSTEMPRSLRSQKRAARGMGSSRGRGTDWSYFHHDGDPREFSGRRGFRPERRRGRTPRHE